MFATSENEHVKYYAILIEADYNIATNKDNL